MGAGGFHGRVRDGIGCGHPAMATRSSNPSASVAWRGPLDWVNEPPDHVRGRGSGAFGLRCFVLNGVACRACALRMHAVYGG
jgi:hypothetical protein